jgi:3-isopropylmalate dehydrogenase
MLETIGEPKAASWIEEGVVKVLRDDLKNVGAGKMGYSTQEVGDLVADYIKGKNGKS